jgi:hypothetical protein
MVASDMPFIASGSFLADGMPAEEAESWVPGRVELAAVKESAGGVKKRIVGLSFWWICLW